MGVPTSVGMRQLRLLGKISRGIVSVFDLSTLDKKEGQKNFKRTVDSLERANLIILAGEKIILTQKGQEALNSSEKDLLISAPKKWDKNWRLIVYDIPNEFDKERRYFGRKLKDLGFIMIQKSVWAFPYECKEEIAVFAHRLRISPFVIYLTTDKLPNQNKIKAKFGL